MQFFKRVKSWFVFWIFILLFLMFSPNLSLKESRRWQMIFAIIRTNWLLKGFWTHVRSNPALLRISGTESDLSDTSINQNNCVGFESWLTHVMGVPQPDLETEVSHIERMLERVKYVQFVMTGQCELSAPLRVRPCGQSGDFLSWDYRSKAKWWRWEEYADAQAVCLAPVHGSMSWKWWGLLNPFLRPTVPSASW